MTKVLPTRLCGSLGAAEGLFSTTLLQKPRFRATGLFLDGNGRYSLPKMIPCLSLLPFGALVLRDFACVAGRR